MPDMIRITETTSTYREMPGDVATTVVNLQAQGWQVARRMPGVTILTHPQMTGASRTVEAVRA